LQIHIPIKVNAKYGLNSLYSGGHWSKRNKLADEVHKIVTLALKMQHIPKWPFNVPVGITIYYDSRLDIDNHGYLSKLLIDPLKGWVIVDDNRKYVKYLHQDFYVGDGVTMEIKEITA